MRYLILAICSFLMISCSQESDNSQPINCDLTPNTTACLSQHKSHLNQCYSDICSNQTPITIDKLRKTKRRRDFYKPDTKIYRGVESAIHNKVKLTQKISKKLYKTYLKYVDQKDLTLTDKQKSVINRNFFIRIYEAAFLMEHPFISLMSPDPNGVKSTFVPSKKTLDIFNLNEEDQKWLHTVFKRKAFKGLPRHYLYRYHGTPYLKEEFEDIEMSEAIILAATSCLNTHKTIKRKIGIPLPTAKGNHKQSGPQFSTPNFSQDEICKRVLKRPTTSINMNVFTRQVQKAKQLEYYYSDKLDDLWLTRKIPTEKILIPLTKTPIFKLIKSYATVDLENDIKAKKHIQDSINTCHSIIGNAFETAPTKKDRKNAQRAIEEIKAIAKEKFYFSNKSMKDYFEYKVDEVTFQFPLFRKDYAIEVLDIFDVWSKDLQTIDSISNDEDLLTALLAYSPPIRAKSENQTPITHGIVATKQIQGFCKAFLSPTYGDHYYNLTGHTYISWNVMKHIDIGFGVIAHEFGHAVSYILQKMKKRWPGDNYGGLAEKNPLWERRSCIDRFHSSKPHTILNENEHTEEDWADYFAGIMINSYKGELKQPKNYLCPLVVNMDLIKKNDSKHASTVFRSIHVQKTISEKLPESCNQAMKRKKMPACF